MILNACEGIAHRVAPIIPINEEVRIEWKATRLSTRSVKKCPVFSTICTFIE